MTDLAEYVGSQPGTADGYVLGAETFAKMILTNEGVDTPLAELERIGRADLKRHQDALKAACATYAAGMTIADCMKTTTSDKPAGGPAAAAPPPPPPRPAPPPHGHPPARPPPPPPP